MQPLYLDNHLLLLDKPHGLLTQPSGTSEPSLEAQGKAWLKAEFCKPGAVFLEAVHRIDRVVGGVVLFARTSKALSRLNDAMRNGAIRKRYIARVAASPPQESGVLTDWLLHGDGSAQLARPDAPGAKRCELSYVLKERCQDGTSLLEIELKTGRYHQIRLQLAHAGMPILGDVKYGAPRDGGPAGGIALVSSRIDFEHPVTHEGLSVVTRMMV